MSNRSCCYPRRQAPAINASVLRLLVGAVLCVVACAGAAWAGDAPQWMRTAASAPLPNYDEKTNAVLLYSETIVTVVSADKLKTEVREAYKILRPEGRDYGVAVVSISPRRKVTSFHGWCIPAQGKGYEVKDKDAVESSLPQIAHSELMSDVKVRVLQIPASDPGNVVGYDYETEEQPMLLQDTWRFQEHIPVRETHYSLQMPSGWEFRTWWLNSAEIKPAQAGDRSQWTVSDLQAIRHEPHMPPMAGVAGQMVVSFFPPGGTEASGFSNWEQMGVWYFNLTSGRRDISPEMKQKVTALTASSATQLEKMQRIAEFVQTEIRYVGIELGIGGWQPHAASEVFSHLYGDCKDKATLMSSMLREIGIESYYVPINSERGAVGPDTPAHAGGFDHVVLAIQLPETVNDPSLLAISKHPQLGRLLFFDPTNPLTPFGQIGGYLQGNYGLLVAASGSALVRLPVEPASTNGIQRKGKLTLDNAGMLKGEVNEVIVGDRAWSQRGHLLAVNDANERIKPIEKLISESVSNFRITKGDILNLHHPERPFGYDYAFEAGNYAKPAGDLLLVRPRVLGTKSSAILETKEPRKFPVEFNGLEEDVDEFEIALPADYKVEELPAPVDADFSFATYHSKTVASGNSLRYTRTFQLKEVSVPVAKADELRQLYRAIAGDERNMAVLAKSPSPH